MGYYNVVRNDVTLTHHESLSRGADDSTEKLRRLHQELNLLYELHPSLYGTDPFYHRYLVKDVLDAEFYTGCRYDFDKRVEKFPLRRSRVFWNRSGIMRCCASVWSSPGTWGAGKRALQEQELATG